MPERASNDLNDGDGDTDNFQQVSADQVCVCTRSSP